MEVFAQLRALAEQRRRHLPFVQDDVDMAIVREIGYHQAEGAPITCKRLGALAIGSSATVQRRLRRLRRVRIVQAAPSKRDARSVELRLSAAALRAFSKLGAALSAL